MHCGCPAWIAFWLQNVGHHLVGAGQLLGLKALLASPAWLERKLHSYGTASAVADFRRCAAPSTAWMEEQAQPHGCHSLCSCALEAHACMHARPTEPSGCCLLFSSVLLRLLRCLMLLHMYGRGFWMLSSCAVEADVMAPT